jgi:hypothetical protein
MKGVFLAKSVADNGTVYIMFSFYIGPKDDQKKVNVSLSVDEANSIIALLSSFISNYATIAQTALVRQDTWFNLYGKAKGDAPQQPEQGYSGGNGSSGKSDGGSQKPSPKEQPKVDTNMINDIDQEFGFGNSGSMDDVPF